MGYLELGRGVEQNPYHLGYLAVSAVNSYVFFLCVCFFFGGEGVEGISDYPP